MSSKLPLIFLFFFFKLSSQNNSSIPESDLNKAISCYHITSQKFSLDLQKIVQKTYSSTLLSCFTLISEEEAKNILLSIQHEESYLTPDDINRLTDITLLIKINRTILVQESKKLENALNEFNNMGNNKNIKINIDEKYKEFYPWKKSKLTRLMIGLTQLLKYLNKFGKFIIFVLGIFFFTLIIKNIGLKRYVNKKNSKRK